MRFRQRLSLFLEASALQFTGGAKTHVVMKWACFRHGVENSPQLPRQVRTEVLASMLTDYKNKTGRTASLFNSRQEFDQVYHDTLCSNFGPDAVYDVVQLGLLEDRNVVNSSYLSRAIDEEWLQGNEI